MGSKRREGGWEVVKYVDEQRGKRRFTNPTQGERGEGNAELCAGNKRSVQMQQWL